VASQEEKQIKGGKSKTVKIWKIAVVITLAVALVLGVALPGLADSSEPATTDKAWGKMFPRIVRGEVVDIGSRSFDISHGEQELTIYVTDDTKFFKISANEVTRAIHWWRMKLRWPWLTAAESPITAEGKPFFHLPWLKKENVSEELTSFQHGEPELVSELPQPDEGRVTHPGIRTKLRWLIHHLGEEATFSDLEIGDKVVVLLAPPVIDALTTEAEEKLTARVVLIIEPSVWERVAGTIKRLSDDAIVIEPVGGDAVPLRYDESTTFILKGFTSVEVEQFARVLYNTETTIAKVVRVWPEAPQLLQPAE